MKILAPLIKREILWRLITGEQRRHRDGLVAAGPQLARDGGPDAVVLREAARMVGVVSNAARRHFADRDELLAAVAAAAMRELAARMAAGTGRVRGRYGDPPRPAAGCARPAGRTWSSPASSRGCPPPPSPGRTLKIITGPSPPAQIAQSGAHAQGLPAGAKWSWQHDDPQRPLQFPELRVTEHRPPSLDSLAGRVFGGGSAGDPPLGQG